MKKKLTVYTLHFCLCFAFISLPYVFSSTGGLLRFPNFDNGHDRTYFAIYFALLGFFYLNYFFLIPKFYFHKQRTIYFIIIVSSLVFFLWISNLFDRPLDEIFGQAIPPDDFRNRPNFPPSEGFGQPDPISKPKQFGHTILVFLIGVVSSLFFSINKQLQQTEREKVNAELLLLKAQINPHFLFNTLNSIYSLSIRNDPKTSDSIVQLSELMRYIMNNANDHKINLDSEIKYINNYIALQKSRLEDTVDVNYLVKGNPIGKQITPLILISFIENAFKHGVNPEENSEIDIMIEIEANVLSLMVYNKKVHSVQTESGIGMKNTLERLEHIYPQNHQIDIVENDESYSVNLKMTL